MLDGDYYYVWVQRSHGNNVKENVKIKVFLLRQRSLELSPLNKHKDYLKHAYDCVHIGNIHTQFELKLVKKHKLSIAAITLSSIKVTKSGIKQYNSEKC